MSKEIPLQHAMFSDEAVDTRSRSQKNRDRVYEGLQQIPMFSARETTQIGVSPYSWLKQMPQPTLTLEIQDIRTEEEKEQERQCQAESLTTSMFTGCEVNPDQNQPEQTAQRNTHVVYEAPNLREVGLRAYTRRTNVPVRSKSARATSICYSEV